MFFDEARRFWRLAPLMLLGCLALAWPAFLNGDAFYLADTTAYTRGADAAVYRATGRATEWTDAFIAQQNNHDAVAPPPAASAVIAAAPSAQPPVVLAGRSIYYGFLLYLSTLAGSFALAIAVQALCAAASAMLTVRNIRVAIGRERTIPNPLVLLPMLALLTPLAYFVCYMVPDIFAGLSVLAVLNQVVLGRDLSRRQHIFWFVLLCAGLLVHSANILIIALLLAVIALAIAVRSMPIAWRRLVLPLLALGIAIGGEALFSINVRNATGAAPVRPPFLTARLIADGPGRAYLANHCEDAKFLLCRWRDRLPEGSDTFLWDQNPSARGFTAATAAEKRRLVDEEMAFIVAVVRDDPLGVARTTFAAIRSQASKVGLPEFNYGPGGREFLDRKVPPRFKERLVGSLAYRDAMPVQPVALLSLGVFLAAMAFGLFAVRPGGRGATWEGRAIFALAVVAIGLDIAVCGALSTPHDRYLMRIIWIVPLIAFAFLPDRKRPVPKRRAP